MAGLPAGTVTFLLTDVEGSTALWEEAPETMRPALARHDVLFDTAVAQHGGEHIRPRGEGDSRFAVFGSAPDAVAAAVAIQRAFAAEPWPTPRPIKVRIGIHTGEAELRDGDYYGSAVNRCARLRGIGHGGQILLSEATAALVREAAPPDTTLVELGEHRLKDLTVPERVTEVAMPDLPGEFPPLASLGLHRHNLPVQPTALLGREREVEEVRSLFQGGARLVTLTGPGGTGKTRLSLQVSAELLDDCPDGVFFVELAPLVDPALVSSTVARTLGVPDLGGRPVLDGLREYVRNRSLLLVLDNFEQIIAAASVVGDLLAAGPSLKILVTSREPLRVRGEREYAVSPLALPEADAATSPENLARYGAVALFLERAIAIRADFAVTDENAAAIREICIRLDGLPLALELAAARVRLLTPQAMAARLERRLPLLMGGARDLPARQQTLRGAIDWSHDLLDDHERLLFRRLGVFVGGWTLDAVEAVCNADGDLDILGGLESLVSKSLVKQDEDVGGEPRFTMLETIREYALERLDQSGETATLRHRHLDYFVTLMPEAERGMKGPAAAGWLDRLQADHDNLRAALAYGAQVEPDSDLMARLAGPLWWFWWMRGYFGEGRRWLDGALERASNASTRIKVLEGASVLTFFQDDMARAEALFSEMLALSRAGDDLAATVSALSWHGYLARQVGDHERAERLCTEGVALAREIRDDERIALALLMHGQVAIGRGAYDRGFPMLEEAVRVARGVDAAHVWPPHNLQNLSRSAIGLGDVDRASEICDEATRVFAERGDAWGGISCVRLSIRIAQLREDVERAEALSRSNLVVSRDMGVPGNIVTDFESLGWVAVRRGDHIRAARLLAAADGLRTAVRRPLLAEARPLVEADRAAAREALGAEAYEVAWADGQAITLDQAITYALS